MSQRFAAAAAWALLCFLAYASISPLGARPTLSSSTSLEHVAAFIAVGLLFNLGYPHRATFVVLVVIGSAALLELLQIATPDRHARMLDAFEKMAGGSIGILAGRTALYFERALRRQI